MKMEQKPLEKINISDITAWMYCPRMLYIRKVKGVKEKLNEKMLIGKLKHNIIEAFSKNEDKIVEKIDKDYDKIELAIIYSDFLREIAEKIFYDNQKLIEGFRLNTDEVLKKVAREFSEDMKIRINNIKKKTVLGFFGKELWKALDTIFISELKVESDAYGLRGRVDRIEIDRITGEIIPFELKSREGEMYYSDKIQLTAYAMLLEDMYSKKITKGIVESGNHKTEVEISDKDKEEVLKIADEIRNLKENITPAMLSNFSKCQHCSFNEFCQSV